MSSSFVNIIVQNIDTNNTTHTLNPYTYPQTLFPSLLELIFMMTIRFIFRKKSYQNRSIVLTVTGPKESASKIVNKARVIEYDQKKCLDFSIEYDDTKSASWKHLHPKELFISFKNR